MIKNNSGRGFSFFSLLFGVLPVGVQVVSKIKLKALDETRHFYKVELEKEDLTEKERNKYLKASKIIERIIKAKECSGEKRI
jgi:aspartate ammonia-lyase